VQVGRIDAVIVLECSEQRLRQKLLQRDPQHSRPDDTTLAIENRLKVFSTETLPVVKQFDSRGLLTTVCLLLHFFHFSQRHSVCVLKGSLDNIVCSLLF